MSVAVCSHFFLPAPPFSSAAYPCLCAAPVPGLYCVGWVKRGPSGIIGTNIGDAQETTASILEDSRGGALAGVGGEGRRAGLPSTPNAVDWAGYKAIEREEEARGAAAGKPREKLVSVADMLRLAGKV